MKNWFQCSIKTQAEQENGSMKTITNTYLMDALSFTEAEARVVEKLSGIYRDLSLVRVIPVKNSEVLNADDGWKDYWYKARVSYVSVDEKSGKEKKITHSVFLNANNIKEAFLDAEKHFSTTLIPTEIESIVKTQIIEVFPYDETACAAEQPPQAAHV